MGTTAQKLQAIANSKAGIKSALESKGISNVGNVLSDYPSYINQLPSMPLPELVITGSVSEYSYFMMYGAKGTLASQQNATAFLANSTIETLDLSGVTSIGTHGFGYSFVMCPNLRTIKMPVNTTYETNAFSTAFKGTSPTGNISINFSNGDITQNTFGSTFAETGGNFEVSIDMMDTIPNSNAVSMASMFLNSTGLRKITVKGLKYHLINNSTASGFGTANNYWLNGCTNLTEVEWPDLEIIGEQTSQPYSRLNLLAVTNTNVRTMTLPKLRELRFVGSTTGSNLVHGAQSSATFCRFITDWYFPQLTVIGRYAFYGIADTTFHFGAANRAAIESLPYYSTLFGAYGSTAVFDL